MALVSYSVRHAQRPEASSGAEALTEKNRLYRSAGSAAATQNRVCYHRQPWLASPHCRYLFLQILEQVRQRYASRWRRVCGGRRRAGSSLRLRSRSEGQGLGIGIVPGRKPSRKGRPGRQASIALSSDHANNPRQACRYEANRTRFRNRGSDEFALSKLVCIRDRTKGPGCAKLSAGRHSQIEL
jgi:hypothetical protein